MRYHELIENNNDDDLFSKPGELSTNIKQSIKQIQNPYLRTVSKVRDIAKNQFGVKIRVSAQPAKAARGTATFWFGDYVKGPRGRAPKAAPVAHEIKAELERQGFECKFTSSEWLSVRVPPAFSDILDESDDDELFGTTSFNADQAGKLIATANVTSGELVDPESIQHALEYAANRVMNSPVVQKKAADQLQKWMAMDNDAQWELLDDIANVVYDINGDGWESEPMHPYNESEEDELFGNPTHRRIAQWLMNFANTMRNNPAEISGLSPEDGDEYENDLEEIREEAKTVRFVAKVFERQGIVPGLRAWYGYASDWWENFEDNIEADTGISISALYDQHYDQLQENIKSDDDLFADRGVDLRKINRSSIEIDNVDRRDFPDFADAHVSYAEFKNGIALTDEQLVELTELLMDSGELNQMVHDSLYESNDDDLFAEIPYKPMSQALDFLNNHDYEELEITHGFEYGDGADDADILNDYLPDTIGHDIEVRGIRPNPDNPDDPLVSVKRRMSGD
jgi:hypothetical protein